MSNNLENLCEQLHRAKQLEKDMKQERIRLEQEITAIVATKMEGTDKMAAGKFQVTVASKLTHRLDLREWANIEGSMPEGLSPLVYKPSLDLKKYRAIETANPALFAMVSRAVTTKPAKALVKVEHIEQEAA
jgi:hypothetical protein